MARPMPLPAPVTSAASRAGSNGLFSRLMRIETPCGKFGVGLAWAPHGNGQHSTPFVRSGVAARRASLRLHGSIGRDPIVCLAFYCAVALILFVVSRLDSGMRGHIPGTFLLNNYSRYSNRPFTSVVGTNRTNRADLMKSVIRDRPEVADRQSNGSL